MAQSVLVSPRPSVPLVLMSSRSRVFVSSTTTFLQYSRSTNFFLEFFRPKSFVLFTLFFIFMVTVIFHATFGIVQSAVVSTWVKAVLKKVVFFKKKI